jgi:Xaa-Pro aminopeptidase
MPGDINEYRTKHQKVVAYLESHGLHAIILSQRANFAWYTGGRLNHVGLSAETGVASLLLTPDRAICITNAIEAPRQSEEELRELDIQVRPYAWYDPSEAASVWRGVLGEMKAACDARVAGLPNSVPMLNGDFARLRWVMSESEIDRYRLLGGEVAECLETASRRARPGMTEHELAAKVVGTLMSKGIRPSVVLMAADDRVKRYRHPIPTNRKFKNYGIAVCGGERDGLIVSNSRLFCFGPIDKELRRRHEAVCRVDATIIDTTRPGNALGDVIRAAQAAYAEEGFADEWTRHHQGGLTGYLGREIKPGPADETPVEVGQVYAWNPTIAGTKSEDTILVGHADNEILSVTGNWPTSSYSRGHSEWLRCDILEI